MASTARRRTSRYETYGSLAYAPAREGHAVPAPRREEVVRPRPQVRPKERILARPRVRVREAGKVSPFAVLGFLSIGALTVLLLMSYVRLAVINDESVQLRSQLSQLKEEEAQLLAKYEQIYDLQEIETQMISTGAMVKPNSNQIVVLDLSEPDNVVVYGQEEGGAPGILERVGAFFERLGF